MNGQFGSHLSAETRHQRRAEGDGFGISGLDGGQGELVLRFLGLFWDLPTRFWAEAEQLGACVRRLI